MVCNMDQTAPSLAGLAPGMGWLYSRERFHLLFP